MQQHKQEIVLRIPVVYSLHQIDGGVEAYGVSDIMSCVGRLGHLHGDWEVGEEFLERGVGCKRPSEFVQLWEVANAFDLEQMVPKVCTIWLLWLRLIFGATFAGANPLVLLEPLFKRVEILYDPVHIPNTGRVDLVVARSSANGLSSYQNPDN